MDPKNKREYVSPVLKRHGSVEDLTKGGKQSGNTDGNYPIGYPSDDGLFS